MAEHILSWTASGLNGFRCLFMPRCRGRLAATPDADDSSSAAWLSSSGAERFDPTSAEAGGAAEVEAALATGTRNSALMGARPLGLEPSDMGMKAMKPTSRSHPRGKESFRKFSAVTVLDPQAPRRRRLGSCFQVDATSCFFSVWARFILLQGLHRAAPPDCESAHVPFRRTRRLHHGWW